MEEKEILWHHGIDQIQDDIIMKAVRQYTKETGRTISRAGMLKKILCHFEEDMDIVHAGMNAREREEAWAKWIKQS